MSVGIDMRELLAWNDEASQFWKSHLEANSALLELPCGIGGTVKVQELVRHIRGVELRWSQRIAGLPVTDREHLPAGPLDALFGLHLEAMRIVRAELDQPHGRWEETLSFDVPGLPSSATRRKVVAHQLLHSQRHWAQLASLVRKAGFPSGFKGDLLFSSALA